MANTRPKESFASRGADFFINTAMASLALIVTAVSAYTTFKGMVRVVGADTPSVGFESWLPLIVAGSITAVVQIGLTILCWVAGRDSAKAITAKLHERKRRTSVAASAGKFGAMLSLLLICLSVSVFFSFNTYFNSLYEGKEEKRVEARAVPAVSLTVSTLLGEAIADHRAGTVEKIRELATETGFFSGFERLAETVAATEPGYEERFAEFRAAKAQLEKRRIESEFDLKAQVESTSREIEERSAELAKVELEIAGVRDSITQSSERIIILRTEEQAQRDEAQKQLLGEADRPAGAGKAYAKALAAAESAAASIVSEERSMEAARIKIGELDSRRLGLEKSIGIARVDMEASVSGEVLSEDQKLPVETVSQIGEAIAGMESKRSAFEQTPDTKALDALLAACLRVREIGLFDPQARPAAESAQCKPSSEVLLSAIATYTAEETKRAAYAKACGTLGNGTLQPAKAVETLRLCHFNAVATGVDAESRKAEKAFEAVEVFAGKFDKDQHPFLKTLQAFSVSPRLAAVGFFFALIQDVAVFIMTFMVEFFRRERQISREEKAGLHLGEAEFEALRYVLGKCDPLPGRRDSYIFRLSQDRQSFLSHDELLAVKAVIEDLRSRGLATATSRTGYVVSSAGFTVLQNRLRQAPTDSGYFPGSAPRPANQAQLRSSEPTENVLDIAVRKKTF